MGAAVRVAVVGWGYDPDLRDEDALLDRYATLTGWSEALVAAGAARVTVVHRFGRNATVVRNGVEYQFVADRLAPRPPRRPWLSRMSGAIAETAADIVHVNGLSFPFQTWRLRQGLPLHTALIVQDHASGDPVQRPGWSGRMRSALRARAMLAVDGYLFSTLEQAIPWRRQGAIVDRHRVHAVLESSSGMVPLAPEEGRRATGMAGDPAVLWVGRLNENKDPLCALEGFAGLVPGAPGAVLTMVFTEADLIGVVRERLAREPRLAERVRLIGRVARAEMAAYYSAADIFLLGSHHEGSGYALIEACACGALPIVTRIPSFRAITGEGAIGRLWTAGDPADCARALRDGWAGRGGDARSGVRRHFAETLSWQVIGSRALAAYDDVIRHRREHQDRGAAPGPSNPA